MQSETSPARSGKTATRAPTIFVQVFRVLWGEDSSALGRSVTIALATLILLNVSAAILETVQPLRDAWERQFELFEWASVSVFAVEYLLRLSVCTADPRYAHAVLGRLRFALSPLMLVDLLALAPAFITGLVALDLRTLRAVRLIRLFRVLKIARYSESLQLLGRVLVSRRGELMMTLVAVLVMLVVSATLLYYAERDAQPEQFSSIPAAMWWGVATLTTIGYGDMLPITVTGKIINSVIALLGIGLFALPAGILGSGFVEEMQRRRNKLAGRCPYCGHQNDGGAAGAAQ